MSEFDTRIKRIQNEITLLKTSKDKSALTLKTKERTSSVALPLKLDTYGYSVYSSKKAIITLTGADSTNFLSSLTLNTTSVSDRTYALYRRDSNAGVVQYVLLISLGNQSDYYTLSGGGSVTVNMGINVRATTDFAMTVAYEENDLG